VQNEEKKIERDEERKNLEIEERQEALYGSLITATAVPPYQKKYLTIPSQIRF
jgi:hypothetical protein